MQETLSIISKALGISEDIILGKCRKREYVLARQILATIESKNHTLCEVGKFIGNRDHTTIVASRNKISNYIDSNDKLFNIAVSKLPTCMGDILRGEKVFSFPKIISLQTLNK